MRTVLVIAATISAFLLAASSHASDVWLVPYGSSEIEIFPNIQSALSAATYGDRILLPDPEYSGPGNRDLLFKEENWDVVVQSVSGDPSQCTLDLGGERLGSTTLSDARFKGITIQNGSRIEMGYYGTLFLTDCIVQNLTGVSSNFAIFEGCDVRECTGPIAPAGFHAFDSIFQDIDGPMAEVAEIITAERCTFARIVCSVPLATSAEFASGVLNYVDCTFIDIQSHVLVQSINLDFVNIERCVFLNNSAACLDLGPADLAPSPGSSVQLRVVNCTFAGNTMEDGALLTIDSGYEFRNNIVAFNDASELLMDCGLEVSCTDVYGNLQGDWVGCLQGQNGLRGNISEDPLFCDLAQDDAHLHENSPCLGVCGGQMGALPAGCGPSDVTDRIVSADEMVMRAFPNPTRGGVEIAVHGSRIDMESLLQNGAYLSIFDAAGRLILRRHSAGSEWSSPDAKPSISWDCRDQSGNAVRSGRYFFEVEAGHQLGRGSFVVLP